MDLPEGSQRGTGGVPSCGSPPVGTCGTCGTRRESGTRNNYISEGFPIGEEDVSAAAKY